MILDEIGTMIWEDIFTAMPVGELVEKYTNLFNEDVKVIEADVKQFWGRLDSFGVFG